MLMLERSEVGTNNDTRQTSLLTTWEDRLQVGSRLRVRFVPAATGTVDWTVALGMAPARVSAKLVHWVVKSELFWPYTTLAAREVTRATPLDKEPKYCWDFIL
jgi:hypothetical protein